MTVPAAAINFRKSRRDTFPPSTGGVCAILREKDSLIINKSLEIKADTRTRAHGAMAASSPEIDITVDPNVWTKFY
jgi:hypothetical protein